MQNMILTLPLFTATMYIRSFSHYSPIYWQWYALVSIFTPINQHQFETDSCHLAINIKGQFAIIFMHERSWKVIETNISCLVLAGWTNLNLLQVDMSALHVNVALLVYRVWWYNMKAGWTTPKHSGLYSTHIMLNKN